jgi:hypothetical protein
VVLVEDGGVLVDQGAGRVDRRRGRSRFERINDGLADITERLYGDLPLDDLVTARRIEHQPMRSGVVAVFDQCPRQ